MIAEKPNIILIVIDALRARNLSCYGYSNQTSPNMDTLAKNGLQFLNCFCTINATDPSFTSIFTSKFPLAHGIFNQDETLNEQNTKELKSIKFLQKLLKEQGYTTIGIDFLGRWHKWDFDHYYYPKEVINRAYNSAGTTTSAAIEEIEKNKEQKFFLFLHYWDTHTPYDAPEKHYRLFVNNYDSDSNVTVDKIIGSAKKEGWKNHLNNWFQERKIKEFKEILANYDGCIHYIDSEIGNLITTLQNNNILDNTMIIITADHGESLAEHEIYIDHHGLYDVNIHVPLIIHYPKLLALSTFPDLIQNIDITPTILDLLKIPYEKQDFNGTSLIPLYSHKSKGRPFVYMEEHHTEYKLAIRTEKYKYIFTPNREKARCTYCDKVHGSNTEELYDIRNDPNELNNIALENPKKCNELNNTLIKFRANLKQNREKNKIASFLHRFLGSEANSKHYK